jgi:hypothetical protein
MSDETAKLQSLIVDITYARAQARKHGQDAIAEAFAKFFELAPEVGGISWTQDAPSYADGDVSSFGVNEPEFHSSADSTSRRGDIAPNPIAQKFWDENLDGLFEDDDTAELMKFAFGEDKEIHATREGFSIDDHYNY